MPLTQPRGPVASKPGLGTSITSSTYPYTQRLGSTYIKLGQFIASSPSLFPDEYVLEFQKCLDSTQPVPFADIKRTVEQELGGPYTRVFASIDPQPLATASVAQVCGMWRTTCTSLAGLQLMMIHPLSEVRMHAYLPYPS
jgi:hypothetical protein